MRKKAIYEEHLVCKCISYLKRYVENHQPNENAKSMEFSRLLHKHLSWSIWRFFFFFILILIDSLNKSNINTLRFYDNISYGILMAFSLSNEKFLLSY